MSSITPRTSRLGDAPAGTSSTKSRGVTCDAEFYAQADWLDRLRS